MSAHEGIKYSCNQCDSKFTEQGSLKKHKVSLHEGIKYSCNQCDLKFTEQGSLKKHKMSVHEGVKYSCNAINVTIKLVIKVTSRHIKCQYMRE